MLKRSYSALKSSAHPDFIPIIDFSKFRKGTVLEQQQVAAEIFKGFSKVGFIYLVNHGILIIFQRQVLQKNKYNLSLKSPNGFLACQWRKNRN